ncbi:MAG: hypothetical protein M3Z96_01135, partial [Pseudomonadota bacterium]|nr:hypothetical protein [Pseudomonadota bacterium]
MSSRFFAGAAALAIILAAGHASAAEDQRFTPIGKPQKVGGAAKSAAQTRPAPLGATVGGLLALARSLNPGLAAAALESEAAINKIVPAGSLPDPMFNVTRDQGFR